MAIHQPGVPDKYPKVHHNPNLSSGVLGIYSGHGDHNDIAPNAQDPCYPEGGISPSLTEEGASEGLGMSHWDTGSNQTSCMDGVFTLSCPTRLEDTITPAASVQSDSCEPVRGGTSRSSMVVFRPEFQLLSHDGEARSLNSDRVRCLQVRLGSSLPGGSNWWQVDIRGSWIAHQFVGTPSSFSGIAVFSEGQDQGGSFGQIRQSHRYSLLEQDGQSNKIPALSISLGDLGVVPPASDFSTCRIPGREGQRVGRLGISSSRQQRLATPAIGFRGDQPPFGSLHYRSFCEQNECPAASLLQLETRPTGESGGCIFNNMVTGPALSFFPFQLDWEGTHKDPHRGDRFCLSDSSSLASLGVVLTGVEDVGGEPGPSPHGAGSAPESSFESSPPNTGESDVFNRVARLRQGFSSQGFSERVTELLLQSWRSNTHSAYNSAWSKWCGWCSGRHINPLSASLGNILEFLADQFDLGLQYRSLNTLRSAISNSHSQIDSVNVGNHPIVSRLLKGMFNARPPAPRYSGSWDVAIVVEYLRSCPSESLSILELGKKVVTLMALANASRCSDLAALDRDYLRWTPSGAQFTVVQLTKTRTPGPPKLVHYSSLSEDAEVCPISSLRIYLSKTTDRAATVTLPKPVFLTSRRPFRRARPGTLGQWIKDCLGRAGVDTGKFTAHSTRSASSSQARARGVPIAEILKVANWSSRSTFEHFYYRSEGSAAFTRAVLQPELSSRYVMCFKHTTS